MGLQTFKAISSSSWLFALILLHFHGGIITGALATGQKCDQVVQVETPELQSYVGNVAFTVPTSFSGRSTTVIKFASPFTYISGLYTTHAQSYGGKGYAVFEQIDEADLQPGDQVNFQFQVEYGQNARVPRVVGVYWQNQNICGQ